VGVCALRCRDPRQTEGSMINLTADERARFAAWLEQEAATDKGLLELMEKLPNMAPMIQHRKSEILAALLVARKLWSIEDWKINESQKNI
jgi:hypothetical protein